MKTIKRISIDTVGWALILLGVIGILLPVVPGFVLVLAGLYLLSLHSKWFHGQLERHKHKYPRVVRFLDSLDARVKRLLHIA